MYTYILYGIDTCHWMYMCLIGACPETTKVLEGKIGHHHVLRLVNHGTK